MGRAIAQYVSSSCHRFGAGWNRFWYTPSDPMTLALMRVMTGLVAFYVVATYSLDLIRWFGPEGMLPVELIQQLGGLDAAGNPIRTRFSYLDYLTAPGELWAVHVAGLIVLALYIAGFKTRVTSVLSLIVVLAYIHRAPLLTGQLEPILTFTMFYLCLGPAGAELSIDRVLERRKALAAKPPPDEAALDQPRPCSSATIATRLLQVHLSVAYLMMGLAKVAEPHGSEEFPGVWWLGEGVWWLMTRPASRLVDLTGALDEHLLVVQVWSHAIVIFELGFALLIWNRTARPLLLAISVVMWLSLGLISGLMAFCVMMLVANLAFVSPAFVRGLVTRTNRTPDTEPAAS